MTFDEIDKPTRELVLVGLDAVFDRVESVIETESVYSKANVEYLCGVCETFSALVQTCSAREIFLADVNEWIEEKVNNFVHARIANQNAELPDLRKLTAEFVEYFEYAHGVSEE